MALLLLPAACRARLPRPAPAHPALAPARAAWPPWPEAARAPYGAAALSPPGAGAALDAALGKAYGAWRDRYLKEGACGPGHIYVDSHGNAGSAASVTVSEAHGYGMLILVAMAPIDAQAQTAFDGMVKTALAHPSSGDPDLMAWDLVGPGCGRAAAPEGRSASDADMDIAQALLLAHRTWGSAGAVDYLSLARRRIAALMRSEVADPGMFITMWEHVGPSERQFGGTRTSDVMGATTRAFFAASKEPRWQAVHARGYALIDSLQRAYSPDFGLVPDFATEAGASPRPAPPGFLSGANDGNYGFNACRVPWRLALDALLHNEPRARAAALRLSDGLRRLTGGDAARLAPGYTLDGRPIVRDASPLAFVAPAAVAAMLDVDHPEWLASLWQQVLTVPEEEGQYYGNSLRVLSMVALTGHARAF